MVMALLFSSTGSVRIAGGEAEQVTADGVRTVAELVELANRIPPGR